VPSIVSYRILPHLGQSDKGQTNVSAASVVDWVIDNDNAIRIRATKPSARCVTIDVIYGAGDELHTQYDYELVNYVCGRMSFRGFSVFFLDFAVDARTGVRPCAALR
jgi:hypothetical protein